MTRPDELNGRDAQDFAKTLRKVRVDGENWEVEYVDDATGEHWLMDYPQSELQGGGPPRIRRMKR
jgi:hypothetical protein